MGFCPSTLHFDNGLAILNFTDSAPSSHQSLRNVRRRNFNLSNPAKTSRFCPSGLRDALLVLAKLIAFIIVRAKWVPYIRENFKHVSSCWKFPITRQVWWTSMMISHTVNIWLVYRQHFSSRNKTWQKFEKNHSKPLSYAVVRKIEVRRVPPKWYFRGA